MTTAFLIGCFLYVRHANNRLDPLAAAATSLAAQIASAGQ